MGNQCEVVVLQMLVHVIAMVWSSINVRNWRERERERQQERRTRVMSQKRERFPTPKPFCFCGGGLGRRRESGGIPNYTSHLYTRVLLPTNHTSPSHLTTILRYPRRFQPLLFLGQRKTRPARDLWHCTFDRMVSISSVLVLIISGLEHVQFGSGRFPPSSPS